MKQLINTSIKCIATLALTLLSTIAFTYLTYANAIYIEGSGWVVLADDDTDSANTTDTTTAFVGAGHYNGAITADHAPVIQGDDALADYALLETPALAYLAAYAPVPAGYIRTERGVFRVTNQFMAHATAYSPEQTNLSPWTASGIRFVTGIVAVDPAVIPLGTYIYVPGFGVFLAADTGSAIRGKSIDISFDTIREALQFGRRDVPVYVLDKFTDLF